MEVRAHDAEGEVALHVLIERVAGEPAAQGLLSREQERTSEECANGRTGNSEATRVVNRLRRPDPGKRLERGRQRVAHERDVGAREGSARSRPLGDGPQSVNVRVDDGYHRQILSPTGRRRQGVFRLRIIRYHFGVTTLVRPTKRNDDDPEELRSRVAELEAMFGKRRNHVARVKSDLDAFEIDYRKRVGTLHEQLDKLELAIAEAELGELSKQVGDGPNRSSGSPAAARPAPSMRYTSDAVRRLFRDVAKAIHPDLARDEATRDQRHTLMVEANRAYALGDEEQLRFILDAWERSPEAVQGSDPEAMRLRLVRRIAQIEDQLEMLVRDLAALRDSPLGKLKAMVDEAAAQGKDLVRDMIGRLKRDILVATNRLDAIRPPQ
jgi:hypothetical protein